MALGPLRRLVLNLNMSTFGVPVTVTRPEPETLPLEVTGIWLTPTTEGSPIGFGLQRPEGRKVLVFRQSEVPSLPRGTTLLAVEPGGTEVKRWRIDGVDREEPGQFRVTVVADPGPV